MQTNAMATTDLVEYIWSSPLCTWLIRVARNVNWTDSNMLACTFISIWRKWYNCTQAGLSSFGFSHVWWWGVQVDAVRGSCCFGLSKSDGLSWSFPQRCVLARRRTRVHLRRDLGQILLKDGLFLHYNKPNQSLFFIAPFHSSRHCSNIKMQDT